MRANRTRVGVVIGTAALAVAVAVAGCGSSGESRPPDVGSPPKGTSAQAPVPPATGNVTKDRAGKIVTDEYGGQVINVEADHHGNEPAWEVEVRNSHQGRIEVDVSKNSGRIVEMERD